MQGVNDLPLRVIQQSNLVGRPQRSCEGRSGSIERAIRQYGFLWWINNDGLMHVSTSLNDFFAVGVGGHLVGIEYEHVAVARRLGDDHPGGFIERVLAVLT